VYLADVGLVATPASQVQKRRLLVAFPSIASKNMSTGFSQGVDMDITTAISQTLIYGYITIAMGNVRLA